MEAFAGDTHLGGKDFDYQVVDLYTQDFKRKFDVMSSPGNFVPSVR